MGCHYSWPCLPQMTTNDKILCYSFKLIHSQIHNCCVGPVAGSSHLALDQNPMGGGFSECALPSHIIAVVSRHTAGSRQTRLIHRPQTCRPSLSNHPLAYLSVGGSMGPGASAVSSDTAPIVSAMRAVLAPAIETMSPADAASISSLPVPLRFMIFVIRPSSATPSASAPGLHGVN